MHAPVKVDYFLGDYSPNVSTKEGRSSEGAPFLMAMG